MKLFLVNEASETEAFKIIYFDTAFVGSEQRETENKK